MPTEPWMHGYESLSKRPTPAPAALPAAPAGSPTAPAPPTSANDALIAELLKRQQGFAQLQGTPETAQQTPMGAQGGAPEASILQALLSKFRGQ